MRFWSIGNCLRLTGSLALTFSIGACTKKASESLESMSPEQLIARGKLVYSQNCIACHNTNPREVGQVGPAFKVVNTEILKHKLIGSAAPAGFQPQRSTAIMPLFPKLEKEIPALEVYLKNSLQEGKAL